MDVERTMEFILQRQAKAETEMAAMRKIVLTGMRMLVKQGENINRLTAAHKELASEMKDLTSEVRELAKMQRATESKFQGFIDSLRRGSNGRHSKN